MALQTEGPMRLNDIHVEAGGTSGTQASLNDTDIRGLIDSTAGTEIDFADFYGASAVTFNKTHTITAGGAPVGFYGRGYWNYDIMGWGTDRGSISPSNSIGSGSFKIGAFFYITGTSGYVALYIARLNNWSSNPLSTIKLKTGNSAIELFTSDMEHDDSGDNSVSSYYVAPYTLNFSDLTSAQVTAIEDAMDATTFDIEVS